MHALIIPGTIEAGRIEAGTIQDEDGFLAALTDEFLKDCREADQLKPVEGQISQ